MLVTELRSQENLASRLRIHPRVVGIQKMTLTHGGVVPAKHHSLQREINRWRSTHKNTLMQLDPTEPLEVTSSENRQRKTNHSVYPSALRLPIGQFNQTPFMMIFMLEHISQNQKILDANMGHISQNSRGKGGSTNGLKSGNTMIPTMKLWQRTTNSSTP